MNTLNWSDDYVLQQPRMDGTHREFVALLGGLEAALAQGTGAALAALQVLAEHTEAHFAQEERWMGALGFAPENCHSLQHGQVLELVREVARRQAEAADNELAGRLVAALAEWFPIHAQMMDAALAMTMAERGFDPETGQAAVERAAEAAPITGCGGSCG